MMRRTVITLLLVSTLSAAPIPGRTAPRAPAGPAGSAPAATQPSPPARRPTLRTYPSARAALRALLKGTPAVIGVGEYHQKKGGPKVASSLRRFTRQLLPLLWRRTSDLVIETWITEGTCGDEEKQVVEDVDKTTKRPEQTESEILTLVKRARSYRIRPHILTMTCADYKRMLSGGEVNYEHFLKLTADQLKEKLLGITKRRLDPVKRAVDDTMRSLWQSGRSGGKRDIVLVYGGALHNDLTPTEEMKRYTYAPDVAEAVGGRFIELDLFVPEYIENDESLLKKQAWFPLFEQHQSTRRALLIARGENAYVLIFRRRRRPVRRRAHDRAGSTPSNTADAAPQR